MLTHRTRIIPLDFYLIIEIVKIKFSSAEVMLYKRVLHMQVFRKAVYVLILTLLGKKNSTVDFLLMLMFLVRLITCCWTILQQESEIGQQPQRKPPTHIFYNKPISRTDGIAKEQETNSKGTKLYSLSFCHPFAIRLLFVCYPFAIPSFLLSVILSYFLLFFTLSFSILSYFLQNYWHAKENRKH